MWEINQLLDFPEQHYSSMKGRVTHKIIAHQEMYKNIF